MAITRYLAWDFDGTLASRPGGWTGALTQVLRRFAPDLAVTSDQLRPYLQAGFPWHAPENAHPGLGLNDWWDDMQPVFFRAFRGIGLPSAQAQLLAREVRPAYLDLAAWQCYPDTLPTLERLSIRGWKHLLLTNHVPELPLLLDRLGLTAHFSAIFNSAQTGYEKPNPRAFRCVVDWAAGAPIYVIGDSYPADIVGAQECGLPGILVRNPHPAAEAYSPSLRGIENYL